MTEHLATTEGRDDPPFLTPDDADWPEWADGYHAARRLTEWPVWHRNYADAVDPPDGDQWLVLIPLIPSPPDQPRSRIALATPDGPGEHWCFPNHLDAVLAFLAWPAPPERWSRHMRPDGTQEWPAPQFNTNADGEPVCVHCGRVVEDRGEWIDEDEQPCPVRGFHTPWIENPEAQAEAALAWADDEARKRWNRDHGYREDGSGR